MRRLSQEDVGSSLDFELFFDFFDPFTAGVCEGEWCDLMQAERTIWWVDTRLSWLETRAGLSALSQLESKFDVTEELQSKKPCLS